MAMARRKSFSKTFNAQHSTLNVQVQTRHSAAVFHIGCALSSVADTAEGGREEAPFKDFLVRASLPRLLRIRGRGRERGRFSFERFLPTSLRIPERRGSPHRM